MANEMVNIDVNNVPWTTKIKTKVTEETINAKRYFTLDTWHYLIVIGIAVSGLAAFVNTYNAISGINDDVISCANSSQLSNDLTIQMIIMLVVSFLAIGLGVLLALLFRKNQNQRRLLTLGIISIGVLGIIYSASIKLQSLSNQIKLWTSWITFFIFLALGWFLSKKPEYVPAFLKS